MKKAVITGSFDPITVGHIDLLKRTIALFGNATLVILVNGTKNSMFTEDERLKICKDAIKDIKGAKVAVSDGLTSDAVLSLGANIIVRGARNATDYDYEYNLANIMKRFDPSLETVILPTDPALSMISSTYVRELIKYGCPLEGCVPDGAIGTIHEFYDAKSK